MKGGSEYSSDEYYEYYSTAGDSDSYETTIYDYVEDTTKAPKENLTTGSGIKKILTWLFQFRTSISMRILIIHFTGILSSFKT